MSRQFQLNDAVKLDNGKTGRITALPNNNYTSYKIELDEAPNCYTFAASYQMELIELSTGVNANSSLEEARCECGASKTYGELIADEGRLHSHWCIRNFA